MGRILGLDGGAGSGTDSVGQMPQNQFLTLAFPLTESRPRRDSGGLVILYLIPARDLVTAGLLGQIQSLVRLMDELGDVLCSMA